MVIYPIIITDIQGEREKQTRTKDVYGHTMNQNISENWYRHSARKRKKEMRMKRRSYTGKIKKEKFYSTITRWVASLFTYTQREKEKNVDRETYLYLYN